MTFRNRLEFSDAVPRMREGRPGRGLIHCLTDQFSRPAGRGMLQGTSATRMDLRPG
jgi:hypothetical protein